MTVIGLGKDLQILPRARPFPTGLWGLELVPGLFVYDKTRFRTRFAGHISVVAKFTGRKTSTVRVIHRWTGREFLVSPETLKWLRAGGTQKQVRVPHLSLMERYWGPKA